MFDHNHYFPVLRWKGAERSALHKLEPNVKAHITPIIEFIPREFTKSISAGLLGSKAKQIAEQWGWNDLLFVDFSLLGEQRATQAIVPFASAASQYQIQAGFVVGPHPSAGFLSAIRTALQNRDREICLRISAYELRHIGLQQVIRNVLTELGKQPSGVHFALDFQGITDPLPAIAGSIANVPYVNEWRSFSVISGAFPKDLAHLEKNSQHLLPRSDWLGWRDYAESTTARIPSFGDYTIQCALFEEREGKLFNFSASIRYTSDENWVIMRGEGVQNEDGPGFAQWPAEAQLLCEKDEFCGPQFSFGDEYIHAMGQQMTKTGSAKDWLAAGFNHHLTFVVHQIQNTFALSNTAVSSSV